MTSASKHLNGTPAVARAARSSGRWWPMLVFGLIGMNATIVGTTIYLATSDRSVATEPDYYAKALRFDDAIRLRESSARLGWTARVEVRPDADARAARLVVALADRDGRSIPDATVQAIAFASARSGRRQSLRLMPADQSGEYGAPIAIDRAGLWQVRVLAARGPDEFASESEILIDGAPH